MSDVYSISALSQEFDITTRTIRFYEEKGLLQPARDGQRRIYSAADRTALKLVLRGKRIGLSLEESRDLIQMYKPGGDNAEQLLLVKDKVNQRRTALKAQLNDIKTMLRELDHMDSRCDAALTVANPMAKATGTKS